MSRHELAVALKPPADAFRIVGTIAACWVALQVVGLGIGMILVGRDGNGPARHWDVPIHDWFIQHRSGFVDVSKAIAFVFDAPVLGVIVVIGTGAVCVVALSRRWFRWSLVAPLVGYLGAEVTVYVVRIVIHRPRPHTANFPARDAIVGIHETSWSFPSGHATGTMATFVALAGVIALTHRIRWVYVVAVLAAVVVAVSRLVLGVHWFTDVTVGAALGGTWGGAVCWAAARSDNSRDHGQGAGDPEPTRA